MRVEIRERPYDLYTVIAASTLLVIVILVNEITGLETQAIRVIFGLPFILFIPGYILISALYPEKKRYFDREGEPVSKEQWEELVEVDEEKGPEIDKLPDGKGLDNLERIALSLGLSIAITPLIGLVLNYTYDWGGEGGFGNEYLGIRLLPVLFSIYLFVIITGIVAIRRRMKTPVEDRYEIVIDASIPEDYSRMDKVLTIGIVIMMFASVTLLVYIIVVPREGESFTELYILGPTGMADNYPRNMFLEEEKFITIGIGNHEHERVNYTLVMTISSEAVNRTVSSFDNVTISRTSQPSMSVSIADDETLEMPCNFSVLETGAYKLRFLLFRDGSEYRDVHIWIKVFEDQRLALSEDGNTEVYLTGPLGDPSTIPDPPPIDQPLLLGIGIRNKEDRERSFRVLISDGIGDNQIVEEDMENNTIEFSPDRVHSFRVEVNRTSTLDAFPVILELGSYRGELLVRFEFDEFILTTWIYRNGEV